MKTINIIVLLLISCVIVVGCSNKLNPTAPDFKTNHENTFKNQIMDPEDAQFTADLASTPGQKPENWFDAADHLEFKATILTCDNNASSRITRITDGVWGKVRTFPITANSQYTGLRICIPQTSDSVTWKIVIQEEQGSWRNWIAKNSTGDIGYQDIDIAAIITDLLNGSGTYTIEIVIEGAVGQYIDVSELYVFNSSHVSDPNTYYGAKYWRELFGPSNTITAAGHTVGWRDHTTNPELKGLINNAGLYSAVIRPIANCGAEGGKVMTPVLRWDTQKCNSFFIGITGIHSLSWFRIVVQEETGAYRQFELEPVHEKVDIYHGPNYSGFRVDLTTITAFADGTPFSIAIDNFSGPLIVRGASISSIREPFHFTYNVY